jgi:glycosyltransferase involved in cell wall biosynthesis
MESDFVFDDVTMSADAGAPRPEISIIIRTKNEERFIRQTLEAVYQQDIDLPFEVIVIDSASKDQTLELVRRHPVRLHEIRAEDFTYGRALNLGAISAKGRYLINLSAHCIPTNNRWIANLLAELRADSEIAATYGGQVPIKGVNPFEERSLLATFTPDTSGDIRSPFSNSNCAIRKDIWEKFPFDEKASFGEDFIWSQMLPREYGIKYVPEAAVYHSHPLHLKYWAKRSYDNGVLAQYIQHIYGLQYRWGITSRRDVTKTAYWMKLLGAMGRQAYRCLQMLIFLIQYRYLKFIPVFPIFVVVEQYYYRKGLADGLRMYGKSGRRGS